MNENDLTKYVLEAGTTFLDHLIDSYSEIAGMSSGFVKEMMQHANFTEEEAKSLLFKLDEIARDKTAEIFRSFQNEKGGEK